MNSSLVHIRRQLFNVPVSEQEEFAAIDLVWQRKIDLRLDLMECIHRARNKKAEYERLSALVGGGNGYSPFNLKRMYRRFVRGGMRWQALAPKYKEACAAAGRGLPAEFVTYWREQVLANQRKSRPMWKKLLLDWERGEAIPGYGTWMDHWRRRHPLRPLPLRCPGTPRGWSYDNLMDHAPERVEIDLARDGEFASLAQLAQIQRDRSELRPLEFIAFDDVQLDFRCVSLEHLQVVPLRGLVALDIGMAVALDHAAGPCHVDDKGVRKSIAYADMKRLLFRLLTTVGIPRGYKMTLLVENETATIDPADEILLSRVSNGQIVVKRTPMKSRAIVAGGFEERHGSPQAKGWLESWFNLLHNELASVPGQFGRDPIKAKAGDYEGRLAETTRLLKDVAHLPVEVRSDLHFAFPTVEQGLRHLREAVARINSREHHRLQGFADIVEWRFQEGHEWQPIATLKPEHESVVEKRKRKERPIERLERGVRDHEFERLSPGVLGFLLEDKRLVATTKPYELAFQVGGKRRVFRNAALDALSKVGRQFIACWQADLFDRVYLFNEEGGWVGEARCVQAVNPLDADAFGRAVAEAREINERTLKTVQEVRAPASRQRLADLEVNSAVLARAAIAAGAPTAEADAAALTTAMEAAAAERRRAKSKAQTAKELSLARGAGDEDDAD